MNTFQNQYVIAKALFEEANAQRSNDMKQYGHLLDSGTDADIEKYVDFELEADRKYNVSQLSDALIAAENAMMDWAKQTMLKLHPSRRKVINDTFNKVQTQHPQFRGQLVDMSLRLAA